MEAYKVILSNINRACRETDNWYSDRKALYHQANELKWFESYIEHVIALRDFKEGSEDNNAYGILYISSEEFPELDISTDDFTKLCDGMSGRDKHKIFYGGWRNYGSSVTFTYYLTRYKGIKMTEEMMQEKSVKRFVEFFTELGCEVYAVRGHTYDTNINVQQGRFVSNNAPATIKLCVSTRIL